MTSLQVIGAGGMLGTALLRELDDLGVIGATRTEADLSNPASLEGFIVPGATVINAAAYTNVDGAELASEDAFAANATGVFNLATVARAKKARVIHVSTDYVFGGDATDPYDELAPTSPQSVYGKSKVAGEQALLQELPHSSVILRTAWLYGYPGSSFPRTILRAAQTHQTVRVVTDQIGQPTWTGDVARLVRNLIESPSTTGIFHATNSGQASWWEFARRLFELAGWDPERVEPTTSESFVRPAPRPAWSVLGHDNWARHGFSTPRHWRDALDEAWDSELHHLTVVSS